MAKPHRDTKGYYRALGVPTTATDSEIRFAYVLLKGNEPPPTDEDEELLEVPDEATRAYNFLKNPARRLSYDRAETTGFVSPVNVSTNFKLDDMRILIACLVLLVGILGFVWVPLYGSRFRTFAAGDMLVSTTGSEFGRVVQSDERHTFPSGVMAPGYLIEMPTKELRWFPATDIKGSCRKAK